MGLQLNDDIIGHGHGVLQSDEGDDRLALNLVGFADAGGFGDLGVVHQSALDLHGADAVAGDVDYVVHAAQQPEISVLV